MVSSLLKLQSKPYYFDNSNQQTEFDDTRTEVALKEIQEYITDFDYDKILGKIKNCDNLISVYGKSSPYEKIQLFRIIRDIKEVGLNNPNIDKFINESYHIENHYVFQLDPYSFDIVPEYIINLCDAVIEKLMIPIGENYQELIKL